MTSREEHEMKHELKQEARDMRHAERVFEKEERHALREDERELKREHADDRREASERTHEEREQARAERHHEGHPHARKHDELHPRPVEHPHGSLKGHKAHGHGHGDQQKGCAIVTGSGQGIGAAIARRLAADGFAVVLNCPTEALLPQTHELAQHLKATLDARVITVVADVQEMDQVKAMVDEALDEFGAIDVLVNNAGITRDNLIARMRPEDFNAVLNINLTGTFHCCKAVTRPMMKQRHGRIISLSSIVGIHGNAGQANYAASKAGIIGLTKSLAKELAPRNITVNAVAPGFIASPMTDALTDAQREAIAAKIGLGRFGQPEDVANLVAFLASDQAAYITGQVIGVDGGMSA